MKKIFYFICLTFIFFFGGIFPAYAQLGTIQTSSGPKTMDPDHSGYVLDEDDYPSPVKWAGIMSPCPACDALTEAYNQTMESLMYTRYWIATIEADVWEQHRNDMFQRNLEQYSTGSGGNNQGLDEESQKYISEQLNYREMVDGLKARMPQLEAQQQQLEALAEDLADQIRNCGEKMCQEPEGPTEDYIDTAGTIGILPFDWQGPYESPCFKCDKLADRLNDLSGLARNAVARLEKAHADKLFAELRIQEMRARHHAIVFNDMQGQPIGTLQRQQEEYDRQTARDLREQEELLDKANQDIRSIQSDLDAIKRNFEDTLKLYNDCIKDCDKRTGMADPVREDSSSCYAGLGTEYLTIGANATYGTGAQMKNKAKNMATGAAMGALGSVLGGSGISLGGAGPEVGSPGGGSSGPKTYKDPTQGDYVRTVSDGIDLGVRAGFTDEGLVVSEKIFGSPGDSSTFHTIWMEDGQGRKLRPTRYYIYSLYVDHKLTVWWTYDHWTNGVHDDHDEGSETTKWRTEAGTFWKQYEGEEGVKNSIWYGSGFETAVKGVKQIGAVFPVSMGELMAPCPPVVVSHVTLPKQDPVIAIPFLHNIFARRSDRANEQDLLIQIQPRMAPESE